MINIPILHLTIPLIYFQLFLGLVLSIAIIIFSFVLVVLLLDAVYRKDAKQYPKHFLWDTLAPIILLFIPSILILSITNDHLTIMDKFFLLICIHGLLLIPLMYFWSKHRKWDHITDAPLNSWSHPRIYLRIAVALIYPALFGFYYSILRYLRMGQTIALPEIFKELHLSEILNYIIVIIFIWPFISIWIRLLIWKLIDLRLLLWKETLFILKSTHVLLLKYNKYFKIMKTLFKISFIWISYFISYKHIYRKEPRSYFRRLLFLFYKRPLLFSITIIISCFIELLITKGYLYYTLYVIMILLFLRPLVYFLNTFNSPGNSWVFTCCYADYIYGNWDKPKYPIQFWLSFNDIREDLDNKPEISENFHNSIQKNISILREKRNQELLRNLRVLHKYNSKQKTSYLNRTKVAYNQWSQIRWVHTEITAATTLWHRLTPVFARTWLDKVALINNHWSHYHLIEQLEKKKRFPILKETWYQDFSTPETNKISKIMESNVITNFKELIDNGVKIFTYTPGIHLDTYSQKQPDAIFDGHESSFEDKRVHGLDQKAEEKPIQGSSKMFSNIKTDKYHRLLDTHYAEMVANTIDISLENLQQTERALVSLKITCEHFAKQQLVWASNLHLFPDNYIPPLRLPENFERLLNSELYDKIYQKFVKK